MRSNNFSFEATSSCSINGAFAVATAPLTKPKPLIQHNAGAVPLLTTTVKREHLPLDPHLEANSHPLATANPQANQRL